jgi:4-hydroxy-tetrahydrodipicolinate synthase
MFEGASAALVTPFRDGAVDTAALRRLCRVLLDAGLDGLVPVGCTGEAATLSVDERRRILEIVLEEARGEAFVLAGTGSNSTAATLELTRLAEEMGVDGAMIITPYYNKPTADGLVCHYREVARGTRLPLVLYNVPGRTGLKMSPQTIARLAELDSVVAVKEACGSVDQVSEILGECDVTVLSGDDTLTLPMMSVGAKGVISVVGNLYPAEVKAMVDAAMRSDLVTARSLHGRLFPVVKALFAESNPGPIKYALSRRGLLANELRLPLVPVGACTETQVDSACAVFEGASQAVS